MKERAKEKSMKVEPTAHLCCERGSLHTWDTMKSSRPKMVTTTAKVATMQATSMPGTSLGTWA